MGGFVLEKFFIRKRGGPENAYLSISIEKNATRFFGKIKSPRKRSAIFFTLVVEKPLKKVPIYTPAYVPFKVKTGHFRQSYKGKPCMRFV